MTLRLQAWIALLAGVACVPAGGFAGLAVAGAGAVAGAVATAPSAAVDGARLIAADAQAGNWMAPGRTYGEQHFSPLAQIDVDNVKRLGLAWFYDLDTAHRAQEATPLEIDGVLYVTSAWSKVFALDAKTGAPLWSYDPHVPGNTAVDACCDVVNRGAAAWGGRIYSGTLDGRLIALDAATGRLVWQVMTVPVGRHYTITGAPRVIKGMVLIGNGGAELGMRGYVTAYDAATGKQRWRFYTVPGDPSKPFESAALARAVKTWHGEWWTLGGGGPVWDSIVYDPRLDLIYIGVGNGSPWNRAAIPGDGLYLSSIVALEADSGKYVWHYQTTPHDEWDYDACSPLILADLSIAGRERAVIMQAPKNGFFYVLDRATGELLSADPYTTTTWATRVDRASGRPVLATGADYGESGVPFVATPGPGGGHSWQPMSFDPRIGLVYLPVTDLSFPYVPEKNAERHALAWNTGVDFNAGSLPQDPKVKAQIIRSLRGRLVAWDPVARKEVWRRELGHPVNGGVLSTAGNLVFQGTAMGEFVAYRADSGETVWSAPTFAGVLAAPISYSIDGEQYIAVEVGWGGAFGLAGGELALKSHTPSNVPRILVYKLDGHSALPPAAPDAAPQVLDPPPDLASAADVAVGKRLYHTYCSTCHGDSATGSGVLPDLRYSSIVKDRAALDGVVRGGALAARGMVAFGAEISPGDLEKIRAYIIHRANQDKSAEAVETSASAAR
jgi:alcohol dehydrogenase (cytochrome c)/quinohemoprotein ethanol dehydrogenase